MKQICIRRLFIKDLVPERGVVDRRPGIVVDSVDIDRPPEQELTDSHVAVTRRHVKLQHFTKTLVRAFIASRVDYCNAIL